MTSDAVSFELETGTETPASLQEIYTRRAVEVLANDDRVAAVWMKGSLVNGGAGFYSDIDLGVVVHDEDYAEFFADREKILSAIGPLVGMGRASVGSRVTVALFADPIELDLTIDPLSATERYGPEVGWVFFDRTGGRIAAAGAEASSAHEVNMERAREIVTAFWLRAPRMRRWVAQADLHRAGKELQCARNWLVELMLIANEPNRVHTLQKDTFILLSPYQWEELKTTYILAEFTPQSVARAMIHLVDAISFWGRAACARQRSEYPVELEEVSMSAVSEFYEAMFGPLCGRDNGRWPR